MSLDLKTLSGKTVEEVWQSQPVSQKTAEFLSLGCLLPGEVRLTPARIDTYYLPTIHLLRQGNEEDVTVDLPQVESVKESVQSAASTSAVDLPQQQQHKSPDSPVWTAWQDSAFRGMSKKELEPQLNLRLRDLSLDRDRVKSRQFQNFQFEFELKGRYG